MGRRPNAVRRPGARADLAPVGLALTLAARDCARRGPSDTLPGAPPPPLRWTPTPRVGLADRRQARAQPEGPRSSWLTDINLRCDRPPQGESLR